MIFSSIFKGKQKSGDTKTGKEGKAKRNGSRWVKTKLCSGKPGQYEICWYFSYRGVVRKLMVQQHLHLV